MKNSNNINHPALSPYVVTWAEFFPAYGVVTKHDRRQFNGGCFLGKSPKTYLKHFGNKQAALLWLASFNKKLDKSYTVRFFTDKQFGMAKQSEGYRIPYTRKQWDETYQIGNKFNR